MESISIPVTDFDAWRVVTKLGNAVIFQDQAGRSVGGDHGINRRGVGTADFAGTGKHRCHYFTFPWFSQSAVFCH